MHPRPIVLALILAALMSTGAAAATSALVPPGLDDHVARVMRAFEVPGVSLAVVKDGRVAVAKGYGIRKMGETAAVDARTLFGIGSNTKVFTAVALGLLVEEGTIEWDAPVIRYLPWFQMWDPWVTREITVRDLLVHRSGLGLGAGDLLIWPETTFDRKEIARRLRYVKPATSFRSAYAYDNVLYVVAGEVVEAVSGSTWEEFVAERILKRVGMSGSTVRHVDAARSANVSGAYARVEGTVRAVTPYLNDNSNPAGSINSSADDMAKWMLTLLAEGQLPDGSRLFSNDTWRQLTSVVTPIPTRDPPPELPALASNFRGYGLGLGLMDYRGRKMVNHTGGLPGFVSMVTLVPEAGIGVTVLTNQESDAALLAISRHIVDHYLGAPHTDWLGGLLSLRERTQKKQAAERQESEASRDAASKPSLPLESYAGTYVDDWYGDIEIAFAEGRLVMRFSRSPTLVGDLEHWQHDTFVARWHERELRADAYVTFALGPDGSIEQARMAPVSKETDFSYDFQDLLLRPKPPAPER